MPGDITAEFWNFAESLRRTQRNAIEIENAPDKRKRLRSFSLPEVALFLRAEEAQVRRVLRRGAKERLVPLSFEEIEYARALLFEETGEAHLSPQRDAARGEPLAVVGFVNFKGGAGKTTTAVHFAQHLALSGYRVLIIDLDSQGSTTSIFGIDAAEVTHANSLAGWVCGETIAPASLAQPTYWPGIDLLAGGAVLQEAEFVLSQRAMGPESIGRPHWSELASYLAAVEKCYDVVVLDTRPDVNMLMVNALHAATGIVVPTQATMPDLASTGEFFAFLARYIEEARPVLGEAAPGFLSSRVLVTRYRPAERSQAALLGMLQTRFGNRILPHPMLDTAVIGSAGVGKETLYEYEPGTDRKAYDRAVQSLTAVNRAIEVDLLRVWGRTVPANAMPETAA